MKLSIREWNTIINALRVAASQYNTDADRSTESARIRAQFQSQRDDAKALADKIENLV